MSEPVTKRALRWLGVALAIAAGAYFMLHAHRALAGQDITRLLSGPAIAATATLTLVYMTLIPLTAAAWSRLLHALGQPAPIATTAPILATTQLGKYLPGNVAHHLGRVFVARAQGLDTTCTVLSMVYETLLVLVACAHVSALTFLWSPPAALAEWPLARHQGALVALVSLGALTAIAATPAIANVVARLRGGAPSLDRQCRRMARPGWPACLACYLLYMLNFVVVGAGLWLVARTLSPTPIDIGDLALLTGAFAGSWILGFFAPGAPAGLGVREAVLSLWLGTTMDPTTAVSIIILLRIATTAGDLLSFLWGSLALARSRRIP